MEFQASDSPAGGTPAVVVTVVFAADAVVEAVETVEEVVLPVVDPGPGVTTLSASSPSKMGTIKLSLVINLYLVTKTVKRRQR